jgi:hypothetical protein
MPKWVNSTRSQGFYYSTYEIEGDRRSIRVEGSKVIAERHEIVIHISTDELHDKYPHLHVDKRRYRSGDNMVDAHTCYVMSRYIYNIMYVVTDSGYELQKHNTIRYEIAKEILIFLVVGIVASLLLSGI